VLPPNHDLRSTWRKQDASIPPHKDEAMTNPDPQPDLHGGRVHIPRSRGALSGFLLVILGAWTAVIPFIGPWFSYAYTPNTSWTWTAARGWLQVLP
jgi:hypothetical protein